MKKILIINQDSGYLMIDIANAYLKKEYIVDLIAGRLVQRNIKLDENVKWSKIISYNRSGTFKRIYTWLVATIQILFKIWFYCRDYELFIVSNPPFSTLIPLLCSNKYALLIYDVYPDALIDMKILSPKNTFIKLWIRANKKVYKKADRIITITEGMKSVMAKYIAKDKIEVIPIWTDNSFLKPMAKEANPFAIKHNLLDKFVIMYSGNLGLTHDVEAIIELASTINNPDIVFVIIGDGEKKEKLQKMTSNLKLTNIIMLPFQSASDLPYSLSAADLAIVTLSKNSSKLSVPSKTYNLLSVGVPILAIASQDSELSALINKYKLGICLESDKLEDMKNFALDLSANKSKQHLLNQNALKASLDFSLDNIQKIVN